MSAACGSDAALGDLPLIYPFLVNDPGEGTQAKRRAHATLVDHLIPPMARAESYGDIARLEQLLDEHANIAALDPGKLPAIRQQIWTLMRAAEDGPRSRPGRTARGRLVRRHAAARRRLAVRDQGRPDPRRAAHARPGAVRGAPNSTWCWRSCGPGSCSAVSSRCRACDRRWAWPRTAPTNAAAVDEAEARARALVAALQASRLGRRRRSTASPTTATSRRCCGSRATEVVPRLAGTAGEIDQILRALDGRFIAGRARRVRRCAAWSTCCPPGATSTPSTRRRCRRGWRGKPVVAMADSLLARYRNDHGSWPRSVGLSVWGTSAMRTSGDDIAEVLALLGVRPVWDDASPPRRRPGADRAGRTGPAAYRRHRADLRVLPGRLPARGHDARRRGALVADLDEPADAELRTRAHARPTWPSTATNVAPPQGFSARNRAPTAPGCCS